MESAKRIQNLMADNTDLKASVAALENRLEEENSGFRLPLGTNIFLRRIEDLEKTNARLKESQLELKAQVKQLEKERINAERNRGYGGQVVESTVQPFTSETYPGVESDSSAETSLEKLRQYIKQQNKLISQLKNKNEQKEQKMAALRSEAINYQLRNPPVKDYDPNGSLSKNWIDVVDDGRSGSTASVSEFSHDLQQQMQDMQQILSRKDQELSEERKRFALREASLLARLQEACPQQTVETGQLRFFL
jgi:cell division protein FtsB